MTNCEICKKSFDIPLNPWEKRKMIKHHISYFPAKIILVCWSCHQKIHLQQPGSPLLPLKEHSLLRYFKKGWIYDKNMPVRPMTSEEQLFQKKMIDSEKLESRV